MGVNYAINCILEVHFKYKNMLSPIKKNGSNNHINFRQRQLHEKENYHHKMLKEISSPRNVAVLSVQAASPECEDGSLSVRAAVLSVQAAV